MSSKKKGKGGTPSVKKIDQDKPSVAAAELKQQPSLNLECDGNLRKTSAEEQSGSIFTQNAAENTCSPMSKKTQVTSSKISSVVDTATVSASDKDTCETKSKPSSESGNKNAAKNSPQVAGAGDDGESGATAVKSKAQQRAERRAIQEAQRALKAANKQNTGGGQKEKTVDSVKADTMQNAGPQNVKKAATAGKGQPASSGAGGMVTVKKTDQSFAVSGLKDKIRVPDSMQVDDEKVVKRQTKKLDKQNVPKRPTTGQKKVSLFRHLVQHERNADWIHRADIGKRSVHKAIWKLGLQYMDGSICGSNARCIAFLNAMKEVIAEYQTPPNTDLSRELEIHIRPYIGFLNQCRQLSVSMGNAIKYLKNHITHIPADYTDIQAKQSLLEAIDSFVHERIVLADQAISNDVRCSIRNGDVILVYSCSSLVRKILQDAHKDEINFRVIVVDGRPMLEGKMMLRRLVQDGINCSYVLINSVSYVMHEVTTVLLGAHALLANGFVMSRVGSSQIALIAKAYNKPVLVCCETYKFCERVQTDSFVFNELGDPDDLVTVSKGTLAGWRTLSPLHLLNLVYDVTPPDLLSIVITEHGSIPCTSVPVVLRVKYSET